MAGGMQHAGAGIGHVGHDGNHAERVHELDGGLAVALESEGNDAARAVGQVLSGQCMVLVAGQSAIVYPGHALVLRQEFGHALGVLAVTGHAQVQRLQSEVQQECVLRGWNGAEVAHQLGNEFGGVGHLAELLGVGQSVVRLVGRGESGELVFARG